MLRKGVCYHFYENVDQAERDLEIISGLGDGVFLRTDFWWDMISPSKDKPPRFERWDRFVDLARENHLEIIGILSHGRKEIPKYARNSDMPKHFCDFVRKVVGHYKDKIKYWQIGNEMNVHNFWEKWKYDPSIEPPINEMFTQGRKGVKNADSNAQAIINVAADIGFWGAIYEKLRYKVDNAHWLDFLDAYSRHADVIGIDTYSHPPLATKVKDKISKARKRSSKPVIIAETCYETNDEEGQARYLVNAYYASEEAEIFCWYKFDDQMETVKHWWGERRELKHWGLVNRDRTPKEETYSAFRDLKSEKPT